MIFYIFGILAIIWNIEIIRYTKNYVNVAKWMALGTENIMLNLNSSEQFELIKIVLKDLLYFIWVFIGMFSNQSLVYLFISLLLYIFNIKYLKYNVIAIKIRSFFAIFAISFLTYNQYQLHYSLNIWEIAF